MVFIFHIFIVVFLSLLTINQTAAKIGALEVLEVLRQDFETIHSTSSVNYEHQQRITAAAIELIVTSRLPLPFRRDYLLSDTFSSIFRLKNTSEFPNISKRFSYNQFPVNILHGTPSPASPLHSTHQIFGFSNVVATLTQKTRYVEWFLRAALVKVNVNSILQKGETLLGASPQQERDHLEACRQLWSLTQEENERTEEKKGESPVSSSNCSVRPSIPSRYRDYFNVLDEAITGPRNNNFARFYKERVINSHSDHQSPPPEEHLELRNFMKTWLNKFGAPKNSVPLNIIFDYLSNPYKRKLAPYVVPISTEPWYLSPSSVVLGSFLRDAQQGEAKETPTLKLADIANRVTTSDGKELYLQINLADIIPEAELSAHPSIRNFVVFRSDLMHSNGVYHGSWNGDSDKKIASTPDSFSIHLDNGTKVYIQRNDKDTFTLISADNRIKTIVLKSKTPIGFSEDQRYLFYTSTPDTCDTKIYDDRYVFSIIDTLTCTEIYASEALGTAFTLIDYDHIQKITCPEQLLISPDNIIVVNEQFSLSGESGMMVFHEMVSCFDASSGSRKLTRRIGDALNFAFSPSYDCLFGVYKAHMPGLYMLQEIDLETLIPRPIPGLSPVLLTRTTKSSNVAFNYLKAIGNMLWYIHQDGQVIRWKISGF
jgi:hypothetical protein